jgi:hypothetical protein|uniref:Uncharacterized protein n=1 Tax=viral metagenome TaxID=1070528 RepID=A0A6C0JBC6_9ZZZZ
MAVFSYEIQAISNGNTTMNIPLVDIVTHFPTPLRREVNETYNSIFKFAHQNENIHELVWFVIFTIALFTPIIVAIIYIIRYVYHLL